MTSRTDLKKKGTELRFMQTSKEIKKKNKDTSIQEIDDIITSNLKKERIIDIARDDRNERSSINDNDLQEIPNFSKNILQDNIPKNVENEYENAITLDQFCCSGPAIKCICLVLFKFSILLLLFGIFIVLLASKN